MEYSNIIVAIGNTETRLSLLNRIPEEYRIVSLISSKAYIALSAQIMGGCVIEPMAIAQTGCLISTGCIISAGAVINHASMCCDGVHVDCNATVEGYCIVPAGTKIGCGEVYRKRETVRAENLFFNLQKGEGHLLSASRYLSTQK